MDAAAPTPEFVVHDGQRAPPASPSLPADEVRHSWMYRHCVTVRTTHWVNVLCLTLLLMSGLQIFNAHPALYWGPTSHFDDPTFAIRAIKGDGDQWRGETFIFGYRIDTTGVLGISTDTMGHPWARAFPSWATLPSWHSLAQGREWHFFFAWIFVVNTLVYVATGFVTGRIRRKLLPSRADFRGFGPAVWDHVRCKFPKGEHARRYNILQKVSYLLVVFVVFPALVLTGLTMSPALDAAFPQLLWLFGGRQSARTIHFIAASGLSLFVVVHVVMVVLSGAWNNLRSMITGHYAIKPTRAVDA
jgi:thiosulfate reductase cytochrome b subunit